jgi:crossover junction endonuclease MUS81
MDDFCSSILDGRYKEQKFRLRKCGITKQIYLIEEHGSIKHMSLPEKSLVQADVNTQLIDHLLVHHTTDPKDTAHYLIELTNYMTRAHRAVTINVCSKDDLDSYNKSDDKSDLVVNYYMTLKEFNAFSNKNKPLSLKEMFAKCLMKIQGFSQEKCLAIIDTFPSIDS